MKARRNFSLFSRSYAGAYKSRLPICVHKNSLAKSKFSKSHGSDVARLSLVNKSGMGYFLGGLRWPDSRALAVFLEKAIQLAESFASPTFRSISLWTRAYVWQTFSAVEFCCNQPGIFPSIYPSSSFFFLTLHIFSTLIIFYICFFIRRVIYFLYQFWLLKNVLQIWMWRWKNIGSSEPLLAQMSKITLQLFFLSTASL